MRPLVSRFLASGLAATLLLAGLQTWRLDRERLAHAETRAGHAALAAAAEQAARIEEQRRIAALQEVIHETEQNLARARADAARAVDAGERLRQRFASVAGSCGGSEHSGPAGAGEAAVAAGPVLADVQRRIDEAAGELARFADAAHAAGRACERAYGALDVE
jgi:hypothetical protein